MPQDDHYKHNLFMAWQCKDCKKEFTSRPGEWGWNHSRCEPCHKKHIKRIEKRWRKINPERWRTIISSYRKYKRKKDPEWRRKEYERWREWVKNNPERRREIARRSYNRRKAKFSERAAKILLSED